MPWGSQLWLLLGLVGWWTCPHLLTSGAFVGIPPTTRCASSNLQKPTNLPNLLFLFSRWSSASSGHPEGGFSWASSNRYIPIQRSLRALGSYVNNCSLKQHLRCPSRLPGIPDCARATAGHSLWDECTIPLLTQVDRFVLFGDLHVSEATLPTCLDALSLVQQACKRQSTSDSAGYQKKPTAVAGRGKEGNSESQETPAVAVFLGDFWHSRIERHLHWGLLRPVLEFWEQWDVPVSSSFTVQFSLYRHMYGCTNRCLQNAIYHFVTVCDSPSSMWCAEVQRSYCCRAFLVCLLE